jgi:endonuclease/exonuclease/phosphatase family metal-dependent hydrolase
MRIAAFNVENLFDRAKAFNAEDNTTHRVTLDEHAELNKLFEHANYTVARKKRMLELIESLGMLKKDEGPLVRIRKIRGQLISRPKTNPAFIKANGRSDWVGWCELRVGPVNERAIQNTARVIRDVGADILAIIEAESRPVLKDFNDTIIVEVGGTAYPNLMVIDGNDGRGIDVGLMTAAGFELDLMRSHVHAMKPDGFPVFSRDCPEYSVTTPSGETLWVLPNHFKSKFGGNDQASKDKREAQAIATLSYYSRLRSEGFENIVVLGDLNDTPDSAELATLLGSELKDVSAHPVFTEFEFNVNNGHKGIGTFGLGNDTNKIDYLLLSPALFAKVQKGGIFRKGAWPGKQPKRWDIYPEIERKMHAASDHHAIWVDINL